MKKILLLLTMVAFGLSSNAQAPCTPGTVVGTGTGYILPDSATNLNHGCAGMNYEQIIYIKVPPDTTFTVASIPVTATVDSFVVDANVVGLPMNLIVESNPALLPPNASSSKTNFTRLVIPGDSLACVKLSGILDASLPVGDINLTINIRAYLSNIPFPLGPTIDTPLIIDYYKITIDAPGTGACIPSSVKNIDNSNITNFVVSPNPVRDQVMITMNLKESANYNLAIIDLLGRAIKQENKNLALGEQNIPMNLNDLPEGVYFIRMSNASSSITKRIVLQR